MDNLISGLLATVIFTAFVGGLAESIGELPFVIIVLAVVIMLFVDFAQSARQGLKKDKTDKG